MSLIWLHWYQTIVPLRPAFSRHLNVWFVVGVAGMSIRRDNLGVTSFARTLALRTAGYESLLGNMHSPGICLAKLTHYWVRWIYALRLTYRESQRSRGDHCRWEENCQARAQDACGGG